MDMNEADRIVVAKPVASRPSCSNFKSFSELLVSAINKSPPALRSETAVPAIRPKTVRFKPAAATRSSPALLSCDVEVSGDCNVFETDSRSDSQPTLVYKPRAKLVSKATVLLLQNMGNFNRSQNGANNQHAFTEAEQKPEPSKHSDRSQEDDPKTAVPSFVGNSDGISYDGYNWRKYGQKQVKGSDYPRSYYKCTHPSCPVKKKLERSLDGQIAEIVYQGEHNHSKPEVPKRISGTQPQVQSDATNIDKDTETRSDIEERNEEPPPSHYDPARIGLAGAGTSENSCGLGSEFDLGSKALEGDHTNERKSKRRKVEKQPSEAGLTGEGAQEVRGSLQSSADSETAGDGFRWRKYGQKVVKGNKYPRSYYRCTSPKCNARKYVEKASDDPRAFLTTYEGKHNHETPPKTAAANPSVS